MRFWAGKFERQTPVYMTQIIVPVGNNPTQLGGLAHCEKYSITTTSRTKFLNHGPHHDSYLGCIFISRCRPLETLYFRNRYLRRLEDKCWASEWRYVSENMRQIYLIPGPSHPNACCQCMAQDYFAYSFYKEQKSQRQMRKTRGASFISARELSIL